MQCDLKMELHLQEFREKASALLQNPLQRQHLVTQAEEFIASHHNIEQEDAAYQKLIVSCQFPTGPAVNGYSWFILFSIMYNIVCFALQ